MPWNTNTSEFDSDATTQEEEQTPETTPRAWYQSTDDKLTYRGMPSENFTRALLNRCAVGYEETLKYIYDFMLRDGPFDVSSQAKPQCQTSISLECTAEGGCHRE